MAEPTPDEETVPRDVAPRPRWVALGGRLGRPAAPSAAPEPASAPSAPAATLTVTLPDGRAVDVALPPGSPARAVLAAVPLGATVDLLGQPWRAFRLDAGRPLRPRDPVDGPVRLRQVSARWLRLRVQLPGRPDVDARVSTVAPVATLLAWAATALGVDAATLRLRTASTELDADDVLDGLVDDGATLRVEPVGAAP